MARLADRAEQYAALWRSAIERNAAGQYKPEDWLDDVNRAFVMAAEDAARTFAAVVDAVTARPGAAQDPPPADPTDDGGGGSADG
jgi:hypothetical protein